MASGVAFLAALNARYSDSVMPADLRDYMCNCSSVAQTTGAHASLSLHHSVSRLQVFAIDVPGGTVGIEGGVNYSTMRRIMPSTGLGCHQGSPWVTSTFNEVLQKLVAPLESTSGNYGALVSNPAYSDFGSLAYLTDVLAKSTGSWLDESPIVRCLLLGDLSVSHRTLQCDPLIGQIVSDGQIKRVERYKPTYPRPDDALNPAEVQAMAVAMDSWVMLRTGQRNVPDWNVHDWSYSVAIVPCETSMLESNSIWLYMASFLTTEIWNNRYVWKVHVQPRSDMSSEDPEHEYMLVVRPRAAQVEVQGPGRVMLVVTNITSRSNLRWVTIDGFNIPVWNPASGIGPQSVDIMPMLLRYLDLQGATNNISQNWLQAWKWICDRVSSGNALNHALFLAAETSRVQHIAPLAHPAVENSMPFYSINLRKELPHILKSSWEMRNWADVDPDPEKEKSRIHDWIEQSIAAWISPLCIHSNLTCSFETAESPDWSKLDWMRHKHGADQTVTCHEATPDLRVARFVGLIAVPTPIVYIDPVAVQESVSAIAGMQVAGCAWMQMVTGISWLRWVLYTAAQNDATRMVIQDRMMNEATAHHVSSGRPDKAWINLLDKVLGVQVKFDFPQLLKNTPSVLPAWWQVKFILQKMNYLMPGELERRQRPVFKLGVLESSMKVGFYANDSKHWQAVARYTSMLGVSETNDVPLYAANNEMFSHLTQSYLQLNLTRLFTMCAESVYHSNGTYYNPLTVVDTACAITPVANSLHTSIPAELLIIKTKAGAGTNVGDQTVLGEWPDPWWDWLLAGVRAAIPFLGSSIPTAALVGAASGLHSFLAEKLNPSRAKEEQMIARAQATKALESSAEAVHDVLSTGREAVGRISKAINDFSSDQLDE